MRCLLVEDDPHKLDQLKRCIVKFFPEASVGERLSFQSGLKEILSTQPGVVVLDMSMPTYEISATSAGGRLRHFAGREILHQMRRKGLRSSVIVVTQFTSFGEGEEEMTLEELSQELKADFPKLCAGVIYYDATQSAWRGQLEDLLSTVIEEGNDSE